MEHNTNHHMLVGYLPAYPDLPFGFIVAWNVVENGYTGKVSHWFSQDEIELSDNWMRISKSY